MNLAAGDNSISSVFQIAKVTRPLMRVGRITDQGYNINFEKNKALAYDGDGKEVCRFLREGKELYVAKLKLRKPDQGFGRQG